MNSRFATILLTLFFAAPSFAQEEEDDRPFSKTVPEAAKWVLSDVPEETTYLIARMPQEGLIHLHHGFGRWIRNNVPVWGNEKLIESAGTDIHPDTVGGMILEQYWKLARTRLPDDERDRIEFFEATLPKLRGKKPVSNTHDGVLKELNIQIQELWPNDAKHRPFTLKADADTYFNWKPEELTDDLAENVSTFLGYHRSVPFYQGDLTPKIAGVLASQLSVVGRARYPWTCEGGPALAFSIFD